MLPASLTYSISADGQSYQNAGHIYRPAVGDANQIKTYRAIGLNNTARYVKVDVDGTGGWTGIDEIEVRGTAGQLHDTTVAGTGGTAVTVSTEAPTPAWAVSVRTDEERTRIGLDRQVSYAYDFQLYRGERQPVEAEITIPYSTHALTQGGDPAGLRIYHFNERYGLWEIANTQQTVNTAQHTVTATVSHFSVFSIFEQPPAGFGSYWPTKPIWCLPRGGDGLNVALLIDSSLSMATDTQNLRVAGPKSFVDAMDTNDRVGVAAFEDVYSIKTPLTTLNSPYNIAAVQEAIDRAGVINNNSGLTNFNAAVNGAWTILEEDTRSRPRIALLFSDGESGLDYSDGETRANTSNAINYARSENVVVYPVGVGVQAGTDLQWLKDIANGTGGR